MEEKKIAEMLQAIPGTRRAANGIIIDGKDGAQFYVTGIRSQDSMEGLSHEEGFFLAFCSKREIIRLRSLRTAHDYLLHLRAYALVDAPRAVRVVTVRREQYEKNGREWSLSHYYHSMDGFHKSYIGRLSRANRKALINVPAGLAFINEANAKCIRSFIGDVVVVSESLEWFYYFMTIGLYGNQFGIDIADCVNALLIAVRIMNGSEALDFDLDSRGSLPEASEKAIQKLVKSQMEFTFGHEYAHYLRNHLTLPETGDTRTDNLVDIKVRSIVPSDVKLFEFDLEYEADLYAIKFIEGDKEAQNRVTQGAYSVLLYLHFIQKMATLLGLRKFSVSDTHPNPHDRLWRLWQSLGKKASATQQELEGCIVVMT